ncbi:hypothetical protein GCM10009854_39150 [Saccharopolyspora halophila]|uniref:Uncharacterized protein n=1 Tax=Saccharopolyspora halophila TaxID=405551 RepID=A0ABN3GNX4_9PSEU
MTNPYGPPPGQQPYPQQPMAPGHPQAGPPAGYPQSGPMPAQQGYPPQGGMPPQGPPSGPMPQQQVHPQGMPQQQMPPQPPMAPPPPGMGRLLIDCSYHWLAFLLVLFKPQVTINGQPGPKLEWGKNPIDLPPGQHQIQVHVNYLWKVGHTTAVIPVNQGQTQDVFYAAPSLVFLPGAMGPTPQETPGKVAAIAVSAGTALFVFLALVLPLLLG